MTRPAKLGGGRTGSRSFGAEAPLAGELACCWRSGELAKLFARSPGRLVQPSAR